MADRTQHRQRPASTAVAAAGSSAAASAEGAAASGPATTAAAAAAAATAAAGRARARAVSDAPRPSTAALAKAAAAATAAAPASRAAASASAAAPPFSRPAATLPSPSLSASPSRPSSTHAPYATAGTALQYQYQQQQQQQQLLQQQQQHLSQRPDLDPFLSVFLRKERLSRVGAVSAGTAPGGSGSGAGAGAGAGLVSAYAHGHMRQQSLPSASRAYVPSHLQSRQPQGDDLLPDHHDGDDARRRSVRADRNAAHLPAAVETGGVYSITSPRSDGGFAGLGDYVGAAASGGDPADSLARQSMSARSGTNYESPLEDNIGVRLSTISRNQTTHLRKLTDCLLELARLTAEDLDLAQRIASHLAASPTSAESNSNSNANSNDVGASHVPASPGSSAATDHRPVSVDGAGSLSKTSREHVDSMAASDRSETSAMHDASTSDYESQLPLLVTRALDQHKAILATAMKSYDVSIHFTKASQALKDEVSHAKMLQDACEEQLELLAQMRFEYRFRRQELDQLGVPDRMRDAVNDLGALFLACANMEQGFVEAKEEYETTIARVGLRGLFDAPQGADGEDGEGGASPTAASGSAGGLGGGNGVGTHSAADAAGSDSNMDVRSDMGRTVDAVSVVDSHMGFGLGLGIDMDIDLDLDLDAYEAPLPIDRRPSETDHAFLVRLRHEKLMRTILLNNERLSLLQTAIEQQVPRNRAMTTTIPVLRSIRLRFAAWSQDARLATLDIKHELDKISGIRSYMLPSKAARPVQRRASLPSLLQANGDQTSPPVSPPSSPAAVHDAPSASVFSSLTLPRAPRGARAINPAFIESPLPAPSVPHLALQETPLLESPTSFAMPSLVHDDPSKAASSSLTSASTVRQRKSYTASVPRAQDAQTPGAGQPGDAVVVVVRQVRGTRQFLRFTQACVMYAIDCFAWIILILMIE